MIDLIWTYFYCNIEQLGHKFKNLDRPLPNDSQKVNP